MYSRPVVPGGAGGAMASPDFGKSVNPISARGADQATRSLLAHKEFQAFLRPCTVTTHMKFPLQTFVGLDLILSHSLYSEREIRLKQMAPPEGDCVSTHSQYR